MNDDEEQRARRTGKTFFLFPLRTVKVHFATLDVKVVKLWLTLNPAVKANVDRLGIADEDLLGCFFPKRKGGWKPANELKTDGVRISLASMAAAWRRSTAPRRKRWRRTG